MDGSFPSTAVSVTPAELRSLIDKLSEGSITPLAASEQALVGDVLLTRDAELFFGEAIRHGGAPVANAVLDRLSILRVGHTSASAARYLANLLLDYATDPDVSRKLLAWSPELVEVRAIFEHLSIQDEEDLAFYQNLVRHLIRDSASLSSEERVSTVFVAVLRRSPEWIGHMLSALDQVQTEIDLGTFLRTATELGVAKELIFEQLPLIGRVASPGTRIMEWIFRTYSDRRIEALSKVLEQSRLSSFATEDAFTSLAEAMSSEELPAFIQLLERFRRQEDWPKRVIIALMYNENLSLDDLIDSQRSFSLYRNIIGSLAMILDRTSDGDRSLDIKSLLARIIEDVNFGTLDITTYGALLYEISRRKGQGDLNPLRIQLLERIDFAHASIFHSAFFNALRGFFIEPKHAERLLEKIVRHGTYPFHETEFLIQLLESVDQETFANFILRYSRALFDSEFEFERFCLALLHAVPERLAPVYLFHRRTFKKSFGKYSDTDAKIFKECWPHLSFGQRLKAFIFS